MSVSLEGKKLELEAEEAELDIIDFIKTFPWYHRYFLFAMLALIIPTFFITKYATSQFYMISYGFREIVPRPAVGQAKEVTIIETKILPLQQGRYSAYARIKNPNPDLYQPKINYVFDFKDSSGNLIRSASDSTFLLPGQEQFIIVPNIQLPLSPEKVEVTTNYGKWQKRVNAPDIVISGALPIHGDQQNPEGFSVTGSITNRSNFRIGYIILKSVVYGKDKQIIAVGQTFENNLAPGQKRDYKFFWPLPFESNVSTVEVFPETDIYDLNNFAPS